MNELIELGVVAGQQNPEDQGVGGELIELGSVVSETARLAPLLRFRRRSA